MQPAGLEEDERNWALTEAVPDAEPEIGIQECELKAPWEGAGADSSQCGYMENGRIRGNQPKAGYVLKIVPVKYYCRNIGETGTRLERYAVPQDTPPENLRLYRGSGI